MITPATLASGEHETLARIGNARKAIFIVLDPADASRVHLATVDVGALGNVTKVCAVISVPRDTFGEASRRALAALFL